MGPWNKNLIVENDGELGRISDNARPSNADIGVVSRVSRNKNKRN